MEFATGCYLHLSILDGIVSISTCSRGPSTGFPRGDAQRQLHPYLHPGLSIPYSWRSILVSPYYYSQCPSNVTYLRSASSGLSPEESAWLEKRKPNIITELESYLDTVGIEGFNLASYISALQSQTDAIPTIGFSMSGGGT